jgi:hypothetical protein
MDLSELDLFVDAISTYLKLNLPFTILQDKNGLTWEPAYKAGVEKDFESIQIFADYLLEHVGPLDYKALPEEHFYKIRVLVELLEKVVEDRKKKAPSGVYKETRQKILALRLGGKIQYQEIKDINRELYAFIKVNQLEVKFFALGIQLNKNLAIPFEEDQVVLWTDMTKVLLTDRSGRDYGYRFFYEDRVMMETDLKFLLTEEFSVVGDGIAFYHPLRSVPMKPILVRNPDEWGRKNRVEIILQKRKSTFYFLLRREDGAIYAIGLDKGKIAEPVFSYFLTYKCKYLIEITAEEFENVFIRLENDRYYKIGFTEKKLLEILQENLGLEPIPKKTTTKFKWIKKWIEGAVAFRNGEGKC